MKKKYLFYCFLLFIGNMFAQPGSIDLSFNSSDSGFDNGDGANSVIYASNSQPDGKSIIGGFFTSINGVAFNRIARLNTNGSLDFSFNIGSGFNGGVKTIIVQPDGKIIVGGYFTSYNGVLSNHVVRLNSNGTLDTSFNVGLGFNGFVNTVSLQSDGKILIGGEFTSFNNISSNRIVRLNSDGTFDSTFDIGIGFDNVVTTIGLLPNGNVFVGGNFSLFNGFSSNYTAIINTDGSFNTSFNSYYPQLQTSVIQDDGKILIGGYEFLIRLNSDGSLDSTFNENFLVNGDVMTIKLQSDNKIIVGGRFTTANNFEQNRILRLNSDGSFDSSFQVGVGANDTVESITIQPNGVILICGNFLSFDNNYRKRIVQLNPDGSLFNSFLNAGTGFNSNILTTLVQPDEKIIVGGMFSFYNGTYRNRLARLNSGGSLDLSFNPGIGPNNFVNTSALQPDGKIIVGGVFSSFNGIETGSLVRLNSNGSLDTSFISGTGTNAGVESIEMQTDGKILVGGSFNNYNGIPVSSIARLNTNGSLDLSFNTGLGASWIVWAMKCQPDGKIIIGGGFTTFNGVAVNRIARLNPDGSLDSTFNSGTGFNGGNVIDLKLDSNGKIIVVGNFTSYNGINVSGIIRLNADGSLDTTFSSGSGVSGVQFSSIQSIQIQNNGKILIGGWFNSYNGFTANRIARLNVNGSFDATFNTGMGFNQPVYTISKQSDENIIVGGGFTSFNGTGRNRIARINGSSFPNVGLSGTLTNFADGADIVMNTTDGITYTAENVTFPSNGVVKFRQDGNWAVNWGSNQFPTGAGTQGGLDIPVPFGTYNITFNYQTGAYSFTLLPSQYPIIGIIGEFNGWSQSVNMQTTDGEIYSLSNIYFPAPGNDSGVKFRQDNSWAINWGGAGFPTGTGILGGQNNIPIQQGFYNVNFNLSTLAYSFEPVLMAITGTADVDFNTDTVMQTTDGITHTLENQVLQDGLLKFRTQGSWDVNFGANVFPSGTGTQNGENIPVVAGVYDISLNRLTGVYNFELVPTIETASCGSTLPSAFYSYVYATILDGATAYEFKIENNGIVQNLVKTTNSFRFTDLGLYNFTYGVTYQVSVRVEINNVWTDYSASCPVTLTANPLTSMDGFCNQTMPSINSKIYFFLVSQATEYRFSVTNVLTNEEQFVNTTQRFFYMTSVPNYNFNTAYSIKCQVKIGGVFGDFGTPCTLTTPNAPTVQLRPQFCNSNLSNLNTNVYAEYLVGATAYKFKVENNGNMQEIVRPDSRFVMSFASNILPGTTYNVSVALFFNGAWQPYGSVCTLTTPALPLPQLRPQFCNTTLVGLNDNFYSDYVVGATAYKFKLEHNGNIQEVERPDSRFSMAFASNISANTTYNVSVSVFFNGSWRPYGNICTITTPALPTSQLRTQFCGGSVTAINSNFFANVIVGATAYRFKTMIGSQEVVVERPDSRCFVSAFAGATTNQTYPIQVAVRINNVWSEYGAVCNLTVGTVASKEIPTETIADNYEIKAFPNPFVSNFTLLLSNDNLETNIAIFDMTGKMVQTFKTSENEVNVGENLTAGVYMVNIVQGQETNNIRVVKQ